METSFANAILPIGYWCKADTMYFFSGASLLIAGILALYVTAKDQQDKLNAGATPAPVPIPEETRQGIYIGCSVLVLFAGFVLLLQLRCLTPRK